MKRQNCQPRWAFRGGSNREVQAVSQRPLPACRYVSPNETYSISMTGKRFWQSCDRQPTNGLSEWYATSWRVVKRMADVILTSHILSIDFGIDVCNGSTDHVRLVVLLKRKISSLFCWRRGAHFGQDIVMLADRLLQQSRKLQDRFTIEGHKTKAKITAVAIVTFFIVA